jgi:hypothetical protein
MKLVKFRTRDSTAFVNADKVLYVTAALDEDQKPVKDESMVVMEDQAWVRVKGTVAATAKLLNE